MMIFALLGSAGESVVCDGKWYHYHKKTFRCDDAGAIKRKGGYVVVQSRTAASIDIDRLDSLVGRPWKINSNCVTELGPLWAKTTQKKLSDT